MVQVSFARVILLLGMLYFLGVDASNSTCDDSQFPFDLTGVQVLGLSKVSGISTVELCRNACCSAGSSCQVYQFNSGTGCWTGQYGDTFPDKANKYTSRGRNLPPSPSPPQSPYAVDDSEGLGLRWEGIGAISGGGATTKLLMDYDPKVSSDILDFLFKPKFGLNLQMLKVEIGGDTDATEGAEPSHMHSRDDPGNYNRGYEWWLMKEARKRNPDIKLYGLPWGWPGWLDPAATADKKASNPFADANITANYTLSWLRGAKQVHSLDIDYIGQWNERNAPQSYNDALRYAVDNDPLLQTTVLNRLPHYPGTTDTMDKQGCTQYAWNTTDGSRWVDEEGSIFDGRSARCLARCVNRNYVSGCHTATFQWHLISSFYDYLPWARDGVAVANRPWDNSYEITSPTWALAHTSQFSPIGWRYARHGSGVTMLQHGGSLVTRISADLSDWSMVVEKMTSDDSKCARGSNPSSEPIAEEVKIVLRGSFLSAVKSGKTLQLWRSNLTSSNDLGVNPPGDAVFQLQSAPLSVSSDGLVSFPVGVNEIVTVTTLKDGAKGSPSRPSPARRPFPLPYKQSFESETLGSPPRMWYDQMGAWEIQSDPSASVSATKQDSSRQVMRQVVPVWPACWGYSCSGPTTYFGPSEFNASTSILLKVRLEDHATITVSLTNGGGDHPFSVDTAGHWTFMKASGSGATSFQVGHWSTLEILNGASWQAAKLDGVVLHNVTGSPVTGWHLKVQLDRYIFASIGQFELGTL